MGGEVSLKIDLVAPTGQLLLHCILPEAEVTRKLAVVSLKNK
jgi:hypothetical protein